MDYHLPLFVMMLSVFLSYVSFIWIKYGIQKSISASYYVLPDKLKPLFTFFCWGFSLPAIILGIEITPLMFFAGAGIALVGAAPRIMLKEEYKIHMIGAVGGIIFSQLSIFFGFHMLWLNMMSILLTLGILLVSEKYYFWWIELVAFGAIVLALLTTII